MNKQTRKIIFAASVLIVIMSVAVAPAMATRIKLTDDRLKYLQRDDVWEKVGTDKYFLRWNNNCLNIANAKSVSTYNPLTGKYFDAYTCSSPKNTFPGACTSFVESASNSQLTTSSWGRGVNVMNFSPMLFAYIFYGPYPPSAGTAIGSFTTSETKFNSSAKNPSRHSVFFAKYITESRSSPFIWAWYTGFWVYDQSFYDGYDIIAKHKIMSGISTFNSNADNYYVIEV
jgi:hypothetical protein